MAFRQIVDLVLASVWLPKYIWLPMNTDPRNQEAQWDTGELDCPENSPDLLNRSELVNHLAQGLLRSRIGESLVTAIYGAWGSGKSWIKHRLVKELHCLSPNLIIVEFSPWQIHGVDELTLQFFSQVYGHIDPPPTHTAAHKPSEGARLWAKLARLSGVIPAAVRITGGTAAAVAGDPNIAATFLVAAGVGDEFAKLVAAKADEAKEQATEGLPETAENTRKRLAAFFSPETASRLLVIMDDFDRLTAEEIQTMLRLIKANANFSGLNYLLLCDPEQLALALDDVASGKGREFLEKIVQNPIRLPHPDKDIIFAQLSNGLEAIARRLNVPFDRNEKRLRYYFDGFLHFKLRNLRSVYRLIDALDFSTSALIRNDKLEVDLVDLCAVDYLRLHMPGLADWIHAQGVSFFNPGGMFGQWHTKEEKPKFSTLLHDHLKTDPGVAECYSVLRQIFPRIESVADLERVHAKAITHFVCNEKYPLALRDEEHFDAYFVFQPSSTKVPEGVFQEAVSKLLDGRSDEIDFSEWSSNRWLISAFRRFDLSLPALTDAQKQNLFIALAKHADSYGRHDPTQSMQSELRWAADFMEVLLNDQPESERESLLERLFNEKTSLYARSLFLENLRIRCDPDEWKDRRARAGIPLMSKQRLSELQDALAPEFESAILQSQYLHDTTPGHRLYRWVNSVGSEHTNASLRKFLSNKRHDAIWKVTQVVARSIIAQYCMSFESSVSYTDPDKENGSEQFLKELLKFANTDFWSEFEYSQRAPYPPTTTPKDGSACLIQHIRRALGAANSEANTN